MKEVLKTEIELTEHKFRKIMIYGKIYENIIAFTIKLSICTFILGTIWILKYEMCDRIFCTIVAILGIIDLFKLNVKRRKDVSKLEYKFYKDEFHVNNGKEMLRVEYENVKKIIITKKYGFIFCQDEMFVIEVNDINKKQIASLFMDFKDKRNYTRGE